MEVEDCQREMLSCCESNDEAGTLFIFITMYFDPVTNVAPWL